MTNNLFLNRLLRIKALLEDCLPFLEHPDMTSELGNHFGHSIIISIEILDYLIIQLQPKPRISQFYDVDCVDISSCDTVHILGEKNNE
ncbi:MAG: hypothetical protein R3Y32_08715 [Bacillota bacterium]